MSADPQIPYGYKRVVGQLQRGDGILDLAAGGFIKVKRVPTEVIIRKTKMLYPCVDPQSGTIAIRKCVVEQAELPGTTDAPEHEIDPRVIPPAVTEPLNIDE